MSTLSDKLGEKILNKVPFFARVVSPLAVGAIMGFVDYGRGESLTGKNVQIASFGMGVGTALIFTMGDYFLGSPERKSIPLSTRMTLNSIKGFETGVLTAIGYLGGYLARAIPDSISSSGDSGFYI